MTARYTHYCYTIKDLAIGVTLIGDIVTMTLNFRYYPVFSLTLVLHNVIAILYGSAFNACNLILAFLMIEENLQMVNSVRKCLELSDTYNMKKDVPTIVMT